MADCFNANDLRRVQAAFDAAVPAPYQASALLISDASAISVWVPDPDNPALTVVQVRFDWNNGRVARRSRQPKESELDRITGEFVTICEAYQSP